MSKPGYVSVSLPTRVDEKLDRVADIIKQNYCGLFARNPSRAMIIEYLVNRFLDEAKK